MQHVIYWYSGTGNSLWAAREMARMLGDAEVRPMAAPGPVQVDAESVGLAFPVHMWGVPRPVRDFLERLECPGKPYFFALAVNAGQVSRTLIQLAELSGKRGLILSSGLSLVMPSNYIPWGGPGPERLQQRRFRDSAERLAAFAGIVRARRTVPLDRGPLWQRILFTGLYRLSYARVPALDRHFWVQDSCDGCELCARVCPAGNIEMQSGRPAWMHHCEQCLACIQWCPKAALQYGKRTPAYPRYHHPAVAAADLHRMSLHP